MIESDECFLKSLLSGWFLGSSLFDILWKSKFTSSFIDVVSSLRWLWVFSIQFLKNTTFVYTPGYLWSWPQFLAGPNETIPDNFLLQSNGLPESPCMKKSICFKLFPIKEKTREIQFRFSRIILQIYRLKMKLGSARA